MSANQLHVVEGTDGKRVGLGEIQATWLKDHGHVTGEAPMYRAVELGAMEIHELVMAQPELRECDFCRHTPSPWEIPVRAFELKKGPTPGPFREFAVCCDECIPWVRSRDRDGLVERCIQATVDHAIKQGGAIALIARTNSPAAIRNALGPMVKEVVSKILANQKGEPRAA